MAKMEGKNTDIAFKFTYSAKEQEEIKRIRQKYIVQEEDGMTRLRKLDEKARILSIRSKVTACQLFL